jgi:hypothetical protein
VNGYRSRKFLQAAAAEVVFIAALAACLVDAGLRPYIPYVVGGLVTVAVGYGAANAWASRAGDANGPADM